MVLSLLPVDREKEAGDSAWFECSARFLLATMLFYFVAKYASLLLHEWSHALWADGLDVRSGSVFCIHYGHGWRLSGIYAVDGGDFYKHLFASGQNVKAALVAWGGPFTNVILAVGSLGLLLKSAVRRHELLSYFLFWTALHNLAQMWSYTPARTLFHDGGDIYYFCKGMGIPPILFLVVVTALMTWAFYLFFVKLLPELAEQLSMTRRGTLAIFAMCWFTMFMYYGALPIIESIHSAKDPAMSLLGLEFAIGIVIGFVSVRRIRELYPATQ